VGKGMNGRFGEGGRKSFMGTTAQQKMKIRRGLELKLYFIAGLYYLVIALKKELIVNYE